MVFLSDLLSPANVTVWCVCTTALYVCMEVTLHAPSISCLIWVIRQFPTLSVQQNMTPMVLSHTVDLVYSWLATPGTSKGKSAVVLHIDLRGCSLYCFMGTYAAHLC